MVGDQTYSTIDNFVDQHKVDGIQIINQSQTEEVSKNSILWALRYQTISYSLIRTHILILKHFTA